MNNESDFVLFLVLFVIVLFIFGFLQQLSKRRLKAEYNELEEELDEAYFQIEQLQKKLEKPKSVPQSVNLNYIKKIESLEEEIRVQKKRLHETKAIAQEANRVKSEFLSNIRHEIRTPMNSIMVFADLLAQETMDAKLQSYTKNISVSGQKLLTLLDDIIELSSVESGIFDIKEIPVDIRILLEDIVEREKQKAQKKGLELSLRISDDIPETLLLDAEKVEEILINLVENAIRFTDRGYVRVSLDINGKNILKNAVNLVFKVEDSGIGIEDKYIDRIFEMFEKPDSDDEKIRGAGLGLSINKKLAKAMGGDINVHSRVNEGSTFTFWLHNVEVALVNAESKSSIDSKIDFSLIELPTKKMIVIDNDSSSQNILREAFEKTGVKIFGFSNPRDGLALLQKEEVDVVFIDVDILTEDDNAVAKILMKISKAAIVTLTSHRLKDIDLPKNIRLAGHLLRPISYVELFKVTLKAVNAESDIELPEEEDIIEEVEQESSPQNRERFLSYLDEKLDTLYEEAYKTNDLYAIGQFAQHLRDTAKEHNIYELESFANTLVEKVDLFDIDAIHTMMQEYKDKVSTLRDL